MAVNIHITIIELNALHTKRQNLFQELDAVIHLLLSNRMKLNTNVRSSLLAVNIHVTHIRLNALHTKRQDLFQELDATIRLFMDAKHWGLRKSRSATILNTTLMSLHTLIVKI